VLTPSVNIVHSAFPDHHQGEISGLSQRVEPWLVPRHRGRRHDPRLHLTEHVDGASMIVLAVIGLIGFGASLLLPGRAQEPALQPTECARRANRRWRSKVVVPCVAWIDARPSTRPARYVHRWNIELGQIARACGFTVAGSGVFGGRASDTASGRGRRVPRLCRLRAAIRLECRCRLRRTAARADWHTTRVGDDPHADEILVTGAARAFHPGHVPEGPTRWRVVPGPQLRSDGT
jgi:hypothetical protein